MELFSKATMPRKPKVETSDTGKRIGGNIKTARKKAGLTQSELAEAVGLEAVTLSRIETGTQLPGIDRLEQIAKALNTSLAALVAELSAEVDCAIVLASELAPLPEREQKFVLQFVSDYVKHWKSGKKKKG